MALSASEGEELVGLVNALWSVTPQGPAYNESRWRRLAALAQKAAVDAELGELSRRKVEETKRCGEKETKR